VGVPARRSVLGRRSVAQGRVTVAVVVLLVEVADDHPSLEQTVPVVVTDPVNWSTEICTRVVGPPS
jgi:hypothetical protein